LDKVSPRKGVGLVLDGVDPGLGERRLGDGRDAILSEKSERAVAVRLDGQEERAMHGGSRTTHGWSGGEGRQFGEMSVAIDIETDERVEQLRLLHHPLPDAPQHDPVAELGASAAHLEGQVHLLGLEETECRLRGRGPGAARW
jgi:hypothetical protein